MTRLELWNGDICVLEVDAIVNPASPSLWMSTGIGGYPLDEAAEITVATVRDELAASPGIEHVIFALRGSAPYAAFGRALARIEAGVEATGIEAVAARPRDESGA